MTTSDRLVDKAKEAFVMAIEIYNKPSINYRLEGSMSLSLGFVLK